MTFEMGFNAEADLELLQVDIAQHKAVWDRFMDDIDATREPGKPLVFNSIPSVAAGASKEERDAFAAVLAEGTAMPEGLPKAEGAYTWQGLLYYCMRELGYPIQLVSKDMQLQRADGGVSVVQVVHAFQAEVAPEAVDMAKRCFDTETPELRAIQLAMEPPRDVLGTIKELTNEVAEEQGIFAGSRFIGRAIATALLNAGNIQLGLPNLYEQIGVDKVRFVYYYAMFRRQNFRPLGPEELCGLGISHIRQIAARE